jgi:hypothetical protein
MGLEWGPLSLVSTIEELLGRKSSGSGLEIREYGRRDSSRWPRGTLYPQKLALTSPTSGGRSVSIVRSRTQATEFSLGRVQFRQGSQGLFVDFWFAEWHGSNENSAASNDWSALNNEAEGMWQEAVVASFKTLGSRLEREVVEPKKTTSQWDESVSRLYSSKQIWDNWTDLLAKKCRALRSLICDLQGDREARFRMHWGSQAKTWSVTFRGEQMQSCGLQVPSRSEYCNRNVRNLTRSFYNPQHFHEFISDAVFTVRYELNSLFTCIPIIWSYYTPYSKVSD